jgi:hypothetical protein
MGDRVPDATTIWLFDFPSPSVRKRLVKAGAIRRLLARFDRAVRGAGDIALRLSADRRASPRMIGLLPIMGDQLVDASLVAAPKQRNTDGEKADITAGRLSETWKRKPAKLRQKERDSRWPVKFTIARPKADGSKPVDIVIPSFGYQDHASIDREHELIRRCAVTDAAKFEGAELRDDLLDKTNTASSV